mmetsp:Transcript_31236/g.83138  ORF Transcript_31236/g.83138 Transcript_31236/m.83138 type:complete len:220 (+) Transcript_31236:88-747(+)
MPTKRPKNLLALLASCFLREGFSPGLRRLRAAARAAEKLQAVGRRISSAALKACSWSASSRAAPANSEPSGRESATSAAASQMTPLLWKCCSPQAFWGCTCFSAASQFLRSSRWSLCPSDRSHCATASVTAAWMARLRSNLPDPGSTSLSQTSVRSPGEPTFQRFRPRPATGVSILGPTSLRSSDWSGCFHSELLPPASHSAASAVILWSAHRWTLSRP